jgi:hypothetical protein
MRRTILLTLFALLSLNLAHQACAQRHGGARRGVARRSHSYSRGRFGSSFGSGYGYLSADYDYGAASGYAPQPIVYVPPPPVLPQPTARPAAEPERPSVTEYTWPAEDATSSPSGTESQVFSIVLKDGSTLSAVAVFSSDDGLHYVDPDERHLRISMSEVDRAATIKLNRARKLNLYLPAPQ